MELKRITLTAQASKVSLLIVPYGIETQRELQQQQMEYLLIVPYGIETYKTPSKAWAAYAFNRTLWN